MNDISYEIFVSMLKMSGVKAADVSKDTGISPTVFTDWKKGKSSPKVDKLQKIAAYFDISIDYLLNGKDKNPLSNKTGVRIPVLGNVAAGVPIEAIEDVVDWEDIPADWMRSGHEYFGLKVQGDSMYPEYLDGDTVIVQKQSTCNSGQDCVVYVNGYDATLKTVKILEGGGMTLQPINPQYPPKTYTAQEIGNLPVQICGVVKELRRTKQ